MRKEEKKGHKAGEVAALYTVETGGLIGKVGGKKKKRT
jgi:hypothetical protein